MSDWGSAQFVGDIAIAPVFDGQAFENPREILLRPTFVGDPWAHHDDLLNANGQLELTMGAYLVRTGERLMLVDAGVGMINNGQYQGGGLLNSLLELGVEPADITDVILTHLHFDHVGWATRKGEIVFPNATYRCHSADWQHFIESDGADEGAIRKLSPIAPRLELFDTDHTIATGVDVRHAPGHTPGSVIVIISSGTDRAMLIGDIAHCPAELTENDWEAVFDVDRDLARRTREALAAELEGTTTLVGAAHFPGLQFGRLLTGEGQRSWMLK